MTNILDGLLGRVDDPNLRAALQVEVDRLRSTKDFGLVFEKHMPENVRLYSHPVRRGLRVEERSGETDSTWLVRRVRDGNATLVDADGQESERAAEELVVVRQFGEPIYPGLKSVGRIERGGDKPFHTVINGENYHALEALLYAYEGKVDCIYIDPPYNTGAKDWKYNNDYVDSNDAYRHSKWLSFIERRLELAKRLLGPTGVLVVTIDEHEVHHLAVLLEQMFPSYRRPMVTIIMNSAGNTQNGFYRVEEHALFCFPPGTGPCRISDDLLAEEDKKQRSIWGTHIRTGGINDKPSKRPNLVYPIAIDGKTGRFVRCGESLEKRLEAGTLDGFTRAALDQWRPDLTEIVDGLEVVWPFSQDGSLGTWRNDAGTFADLVEQGFVRIRRNESAPGGNQWSISYVTEGNRKKVKDGVIAVLGRDPRDGSLLLSDEKRPVVPKTVWKRRLHDATNWGSPMLTAFVGSNPFTYPKSPYAVRDTLATMVGENPEALIVDFFAGSGTTLHATCMLNAGDGGRRRCILVTNNEVGEADAAHLSSLGLFPGDPEWEARGVFEVATKPRCTAVITGHRSEGTPVAGEYDDGTAYAEGFFENVEFVELIYLDRNDVSRGKAFQAIAPLLWMKVGACGEMIAKQKSTFDAPKGARYAVLFNIEVWPKFVEDIRGREDLEHVFIVTDSLAMYQQVVAELPAEVETTMLYEDYLRNFEINMGEAQR